MKEIKTHFGYLLVCLINFLSNFVEKSGFISIKIGYLFLDAFKTSSIKGIGFFFNSVLGNAVGRKEGRKDVIYSR